MTDRYSESHVIATVPAGSKFMSNDGTTVEIELPDRGLMTLTILPDGNGFKVVKTTSNPSGFSISVSPAQKADV